MAGDICDCCLRPEKKVLGVASSSLGAISFAFCEECASIYAEPESMIQFTLDTLGGKRENVRPEFFGMNTFKNGAYISVEEFFTKHYKYHDINAEYEEYLRSQFWRIWFVPTEEGRRAFKLEAKTIDDVIYHNKEDAERECYIYAADDTAPDKQDFYRYEILTGL